MQVIDQIKMLLESAQTIAVFGHEHVDGDALGSMLALGKVLEKQGKKVRYFTPNPPGKVFGFLNLGDKVEYQFDYATYDLLVFLDFNHYKRISAFSSGHEAYFESQQKVVIDHHQSDEELLNAIVCRDTSEIANCGLLFRLIFKWWPECLDAEIATYLYMGLSTDSGNFRYDEGEQSIKTFEVATELLKLGANKKLVIDEIFRNKTYASVEFMQLLLQRMQSMTIEEQGILRNFHLIYSYYDDQEFIERNVDHDEADYGLYIMQDISNTDLVLLIKKVGVFLKVSLRSRGNVDCSFLARQFGGGGHQNAAGFKVQGSGYFDQDIKMILESVKVRLLEKY